MTTRGWGNTMIRPNYILKRVTGTFKKEKQLIFPKYISVLLQLKLYVTKSFTKFFQIYRIFNLRRNWKTVT